jgi:hypothetical protein
MIKLYYLDILFRAPGAYRLVLLLLPLRGAATSTLATARTDR